MGFPFGRLLSPVNGVCAFTPDIKPALQQSLVSAFLVFGWPGDDRRNSCMAEEKWAKEATYIMLFLGYYINSRTLMLTWPLYKRQVLLQDITDALANSRQVPLKTVASILGKVRAAGEIRPCLLYTSPSPRD